MRVSDIGSYFVFIKAKITIELLYCALHLNLFMPVPDKKGRLEIMRYVNQKLTILLQIVCILMIIFQHIIKPECLSLEVNLLRP